MEKAILVMCLTGVPIRKIEDITQVVWDNRVSPSSISLPSPKIFERVDAWCNDALERKYPYVLVDGIWLKWT